MEGTISTEDLKAKLDRKDPVREWRGSGALRERAYDRYSKSSVQPTQQ